MGKTTDNQVPKEIRTAVPEWYRQPLSDPSAKCTLMFPYVASGWGNWAKVTCNYAIKAVNFICKTSAIWGAYRYHNCHFQRGKKPIYRGE